ncbi:MAG: hypothetical protein PHC85_00570 [Candidatus Pacebacteria bacterium]|nr:hypothetical protein [Candidatus Paceibacterota bacterium]
MPTTEKNKCINIVKRLGLNFGAIDMIVTPNNEYYFLEINANGQWAWIEALTKLPIASEISHLFVYHSNSGIYWLYKQKILYPFFESSGTKNKPMLPVDPVINIDFISCISIIPKYSYKLKIF